MTPSAELAQMKLHGMSVRTSTCRKCRMRIMGQRVTVVKSPIIERKRDIWQREASPTRRFSSTLQCSSNKEKIGRVHSDIKQSCRELVSVSSLGLFGVVIGLSGVPLGNYYIHSTRPKPYSAFTRTTQGNLHLCTARTLLGLKVYSNSIYRIHGLISATHYQAHTGY